MFGPESFGYEPVLSSGLRRTGISGRAVGAGFGRRVIRAARDGSPAELCTHYRERAGNPGNLFAVGLPSAGDRIGCGSNARAVTGHHAGSSAEPATVANRRRARFAGTATDSSQSYRLES